MKVRIRSSENAGFTLLELIVSGAVMAMILAGAYACLRTSLASQTLIESRADVLQTARVAMAMITADLRSACPLSKDFDFVGLDRMLGNVEADNLDFATHHYVPRRSQEADWCEVSYFLDKDAGSGSFNLWRRRDPTPDLEPLAGGNREEIARGVRGLRFEYYDGFEWFDDWGDTDTSGKRQSSVLAPSNLTGLPEAVRITLWLAPESRSATHSTSTSTATAQVNEEAVEPPLVFQTIARLNVPARSTRTSAGGSASTGPPGQGAAGPTTPTGGPVP